MTKKELHKILSELLERGMKSNAKELLIAEYVDKIDELQQEGERNEKRNGTEG